MPTFETRRHVPYSPRQMYDLVADVERYPEFLPLCDALTVLARGKDSSGRDTITCEMRVGYGAIQERFKSRVTLDPATLAVTAIGSDGPFSQLENRWKLLDAPRGGCDIDFFISYEFRNLILGMLVGSMFDTAFRKFTAAFEDRAREIYGAPVV